LALYGYSLKDDLDNKFEFTYQDGKPFLKVLDNSIQRINNDNSNKGSGYAKPFPIADVDTREPKEEKITHRFGLVMQEDPTSYPYISFNIIKGEVNEEGTSFIGKVEKVDLAKLVIPVNVNEEDKILLQLVKKLQPAEMAKFLNKEFSFPRFLGYHTSY
jgi:non-specific serine/threonine protein kinase